MSAARSRRVVTTGSISLALALAAPLAAFADPGAPQGPPADPGTQQSATATATIGEQVPPAGASNQGVGDEEAGERKVTICHATGSDSNPYVLITVATSAVLNGHADHQDVEDIIPSFTYTDGSGATRTFAAQGDQSILAAQCAAADEAEGDTGAVDQGDQSGGGDADAETPVQGSTPDQPAQSPTTPVQGTTPDQSAQSPTTPAQGTSPEQAGANPAAPSEISGGTQAPATGELPQTPTPAPAPAPAAPSSTAVTPALGEGAVVEQGVAAQAIGGTTTEAATVALNPVPTTVSARGAVTPATLPFTGGAEMGVLIALGVGALGLGGIANRVGTRELKAKHVLR